MLTHTAALIVGKIMTSVFIRGRMLVFLLMSALGTILCSNHATLIHDEAEARAFLDYFNTEVQKKGARNAELKWIYNTNITDYNQENMIKYSLEYTQFWTEVGQNASLFNFNTFSCDVARQLDMLQYIGPAALKDSETILEYNNLKAEASERYSTGKVCKNPDDPIEKCLPLDPDLTHIMASSRNYEELLWAWKGWRDAVGAPAKQDFIRKGDILNQIAQANGYEEYGAYWRSRYEIDNLEEQAEHLYNQLRPLYANLHAYTRRKLHQVYGGFYVNLRGPIPAHLLGDMWAQSWIALFDILEPFSEKAAVDITDNLKKQNYTALKMFEVAEEFFISLGLLPMPESFWEDSMFERPDDREVVCHATAWDFGNQKDYRIKMCTELTMEDFVTIHHEMGHIQYGLQYKDQPWLFRGAANPGFHEAIGDTLALSVETPKHLQEIGLLEEAQEDEEAELNFLMRMAATSVAYLPFAYLVDQWRWAVFNGSIAPDQYNTKWWELRTRYQGIVPPVKRTEQDFDPAAKFHVATDYPYLTYFIAKLFQFSFHKALCKEANHPGPLHRCDIYRSKQAGQKLADMMKMGKSRPWPEAMELLTGQRELDASALMEYFQPLTDWLVEQNKLNGDEPGWPDVLWMPQDPNTASSLDVVPTIMLVVFTIVVILKQVA